MSTSDWPLYYKDKLYIANTKSNVGIITLWTPMQAILPNLNQKQFCIGGQLYSKRGINFILRNILANPVIDTLIICGSNRSESAESVINFIDKGVDSEHNVVGVDKSPIDKEIPLEVINEIRSRIKYINLVNNSSFKKVQEELDKLNLKESNSLWSTPRIFPDPEPVTADKFPSEKSTFTVRGAYIKEVWPQVLRHIMKFGSVKGMIKVGEVKELVNLVTVIEEEDPYKPEMVDWFNFNKSDLKLYYKGFFEKEAVDEDYGYGARMFSYPLGIPNNEYKSQTNTLNANSFKESYNIKNTISLNQVEEIYLKLKNYKYDRGAVISIWNPWVDNIAVGWMSDTDKSKSGNVPCMTQLQFSYREHKLMLTAYFRSNDMYDAWPRNAFALRKLQFDLAKKLDLKPGFLTIVSSLAQIYDGNWESASKIVEKYKNITFCRPDPRGSVVIEVEGDNIVLSHMDTSGNNVLQQFKVDGKQPKAAQRASDLLLENIIFSELPHAMDIARELQKAEIAIKHGFKFTQDRDL